jgi:hypothetical protein
LDVPQHLIFTTVYGFVVIVTVCSLCRQDITACKKQSGLWFMVDLVVKYLAFVVPTGLGQTGLIGTGLCTIFTSMIYQTCQLYKVQWSLRILLDLCTL